MDGNKYLKGSELGAAAVDFVAKDAAAEEGSDDGISLEEPAAEEPAAEEPVVEESSSDGAKEPEVVWRNSGDTE